MATFTIKTRTVGSVSFYVSDHGGQVYIDRGSKNAEVGGPGPRIGVSCASAELPVVARKWWADHVKQHQRAGLQVTAP
jgi:hypothetical protein